MLAKPKGTKISGLGNIVVRRALVPPKRSASAPALEDADARKRRSGRLAPLSTSTHPDRQLYTTSVAAALDAHKPFVVVFATPKFCTSRTCGPVVDVVSHVRKQLAGSPVRFIHVEVFEATIPRRDTTAGCGSGGSRASRGCFSSGATGRIKASFEGSLSPRELRAAIESKLLH